MPSRPTEIRAFHPECFRRIGVTRAWERYGSRLSWGRGQCLAILDDGCDLESPAWRVALPWGPKVVATHNSIDGNDDPSPVPPGYHGTSVGHPSSLNLDGVGGIAFNDSVAHVRCVRVAHLDGQTEAPSMAAGLEWVLEHHHRLNITAVNLSPLDDGMHDEPVATILDPVLRSLRAAGVWVSSPSGNHDHARGISWPACQDGCFGIGATRPDRPEVHLDRGPGIDLLVAGEATSSSNAFAAASALILREAFEQGALDWRLVGSTLPEAIMAVFQMTGRPVVDPVTQIEYRELDLLAAIDHTLGEENPEAAAPEHDRRDT